MISIAIIDIIGLCYDGNTLNKRGLGGSESSVILISKELSKLGFNVTVFNNCNDTYCSPGIYDGVEYKDLSGIDDYKFDVVISSRTIYPFLKEKYWSSFDYDISKFHNIQKNTKLKIIWMHDTFCAGDNLIEEHLVDGCIDEIFTLSDFHTSYVSNCDHGGKRMFEVIKDKIFLTRNGVVNYGNASIKEKDTNTFVFNAAVTKGMVELVKLVWPKVKRILPETKLIIIGGYYKFKNDVPDDQEKVYQDLYDNYNNTLGIEFTGIIPQHEVAKILSKASYMLYPTAFPETFGISALESLNYNTPLITCKFGALEETALSDTSYFIDYPIVPNSLFPNINTEEQVNKFVDLVVTVYSDQYLHQQKMYNCNKVKDISSWDTIAIQWKQHIFRKLHCFLPADEFSRVNKINNQVHDIFKRRFSNPEEWVEPKSGKEQKIVVISPVFNAESYISRCILSVASQNYSNYEHIIIDDRSNDNTLENIVSVIESLPEDRRNKTTTIARQHNHGALFNQVNSIIDLKDDDIIMLLDGDDWLSYRNDIFDIYNNIFSDGYDFSYGSCLSLADNIPLIAQPYDDAVIESRTFRDQLFNWNLPYTHLRVFRKSLINGISFSKFKDEHDNWFKAGGDVTLFYNLIEKANKIKVVQKITCVYNDVNPLNDYKVNGDEQNMNANKQLKKNLILPKMNKKILIAIPTAKYVETETFKSIYDLDIPEGYDVDIQFFFGYQIDQVRNLIADYTIRNGYDYLFSVDSDIILPQDCLVKMINHDVHMISGAYIQRKHGQHILELYDTRYNNINYQDVKEKKCIDVAACGFGCVLIMTKVLEKVGYPQFVYTSAIDHKNTVSEDIDFCKKVSNNGFMIFADLTIKCGHIGGTYFNI